MEEKIYLQEQSLLVTSGRVEINGQTFAVRNIGSVKVMSGGRPWLGALAALIGIVAVTDDRARALGLVLLAGAAYLIWQKFAQRELVLVSGGGETIALKSTNARAVDRLRAAIAEAISNR